MAPKRAEVFIEPLTRIEGHLAIYATADLETKRYVEAYVYGTMFRGIEVILKGREPADAIWITQRICGVCPTPHGLASVECVDMTYNAPPTPFAVAMRDLALASDQMYDSSLGCGILQGPDYSEAIVKRLNPDWWNEAQKRKAERSDLHGYGTIADIMRALNPISGSLWLKCLQMAKIGRKMASLIGGKHPHVNSFVPGGVAKTVTASDLEMFAAMLAQQIAFSKELTAAFDDLAEFLVDVGYGEAGVRENNFLSYGAYDDPYAYNAKYEDMAEWGEKRSVTPGVVIGGELVTTDLVEINVGIREYVTHSYYEEWDGRDLEKDPLGNELAPEHPWNKDTLPKPGPPKAWEGKYSWTTAPRWHDWRKRIDGEVHVLEAGPIARLWVTAKARKVPESTGSSLKFTLPRASVVGFRVTEELTLEWKIPEKVNAIERVRARAYYHAYSAYVAYSILLKALEMVKKGEDRIWNPYRRPKEGIGVGLVEAMRGALGHWCIMRNGRVHRYQVITPTTWNASPRGPKGEPGPYEKAILESPVTEPVSERLNGIDVVRIVRSFDPCLACSVHVFNGDGKVLRRITLTPGFSV